MRVVKTEKREIEMPVTVETFCDKCDKSIYPDNNFEFEFLLKTSSYYQNIDEVQHRLDICPTCAEDLIHLLKENNYSVQTKEY